LIQSYLEPILKRLPVFFFRLESGREPVREWLKTLELADRRSVGEDIKEAELSWPVGMPLVRPMSGGLWEVRCSLRGGRIARILFCIEQGRMILLHGFVKKTQKTPQRDLDLALKRKQGGTT
jgi:phage-related protein